MSRKIHKIIIFSILFSWFFTGQPRIFSVWNFPPETRVAQALTGIVRPDGDNVVNWSTSGSTDTSCAGGTNCDFVDEAQTQPSGTGDTLYVFSSTDNATETYTMETIGSIATATAVNVWLYAYSTRIDRKAIDVTVRWDNTDQSTIQVVPSANTTYEWLNADFTGLSLIQSQLDSLEIKMTGIKLAGPGNSEEVRVEVVYADITYTLPPDLTWNTGAADYEIWDSSSLTWDAGTLVCSATLTDDNGSTVTCDSSAVAASTQYRVQAVLKNVGTAGVNMNGAGDYVDDKSVKGGWAGTTPTLGTCGVNDFDTDDGSVTCTIAFSGNDVRITNTGGGDVVLAATTGTQGFMFLITTDSDVPASDSTSFMDTSIDANIEDSSKITITGPAGALTVDIVDGAGSPVASPSMAMTGTTFSFPFQTATGTFGVAAENIRVQNTTGNPEWTLTLAADTGSTAFWDGALGDYDFNDPTASAGDGGDADSLGGQMTVDASGATITPEGGCSTTGLVLGSSSSFEEGVTDSITLLTAGATADTGCYWDVTGVSISQTIPPEQPADSFSIDMILTVTAV